MNLGETIKTYRNKRNMKQRELAELIGVDRSLISHYERGNVNNLPISRVVDIAKALRVSPMTLMRG